MKISVIITAHNRRNYLHRAINSVITQSLSREYFEIVVVKNFKDNILDEMISSAEAKNILVPKETNVGFDMYRGIMESEGDVICFLDDDDIFSKDRLEKVYSVFEDKSVIYFRNDIFYLNDNDQIILNVRKFKLSNELRITSNKIHKLAAYLDRIKAGFNISSIAFRRNVIDKRQLDYLKDHLTQSTDTFIFSCAACCEGYFVLSPIDLTGYRLNDSTSKTLTTERDSIERLIFFWKKLLSSYIELKSFFGKCNENYLTGRIISQEMAIRKLSLRNNLVSNVELKYLNSVLWAIKSKNYLMFYDLFLIVKLKLVNLVNGIK